MSNLLERLASMAGVMLKESEFPRLKTIKINLADVALDDQPDAVVSQFVDLAIEMNDVLTVEDYSINRAAGTIEFSPMLSGGEISPTQVQAFRNFMFEFLSDPENMEMYESVQEGEELEEARSVSGNTMQRYGQKIIKRAKEKAAAEKAAAEKKPDDKKDVKEATGSNTPYDDIGAWKAACKKAGCEVYSQGAADGKYTAKKDDEVCGRFNKESGEGWLHSSAMSEAAIGEPWVVHLKFRKQGEERTFNSANYKLNAPDKERAKSYAIADYKKKGYVDVSAVRVTPAKAVKEDANYDDEGNVVPDAPLPQGLAEIAKKMGFQTLETQNSDSLDFKDVAVWSVKDALLAAYNLGKSQGAAAATPADQQPQSGGLPPPQTKTSADHQQVSPVGR